MTTSGFAVSPRRPRLRALGARCSSILVLLATLAAAAAGAIRTTPIAAQARQQAPAAEPPSIAEKTAGMRALDGFFPLYWDDTSGQLWMEISRFDTEVLYIRGLGSGLGSNDIGLDRGILQGSSIVEFERVGPKVLMVQPNYAFRASTTNPAEVRAVTDAFARSVLHGFTVAAETDGRVLVDVTDFLLRDATDIAQRLRPGTYRLEASRSAIHLPMTMNFPENTEMEAELTFVRQPGGEGGGGFQGGGAAFEGVGSVAATAEAASLRVHHSLVQLPGPGYEPREFDPRAGYGAVTWDDYATPLGEPMTKRFIRRHRLEKRDPSAAVSDPVEPIIYYLDPGAPEPVRSALLEGARWWNQAFEAAGYRDAFRVEMLPEGVSTHDVRYNVINWVHRSTRGWSTGASVTDPRTGEIIKGVVTLGSLRIRQDYLIAEGLLSPYETGEETPPELEEWAVARIRQLSAHEVGHTLGLGHNYYDSERGRISVMDYPHPLVTLTADGALDYSQVYERGIGEWDSVAIAYGYQDFPEGVDERAALEDILDGASQRDVLYMTNQDVAVSPRADQWSNGTDAAAELKRMLEVRRFALDRFGQRAIKRGMPLATIEEVLVPLYLHHRYQVDAAASMLGGQHYVYALRGDDRAAFQRATAAEQRAALDALAAALQPSALALPRDVIAQLPPRPAGYGFHRELFPRYTGGAFDAVAPAVVAADMVVSNALDPQRAARLVEQSALEPELPGLGDVVDALFAASFGARAADAYEAEIKRAVERVVVERLEDLAEGGSMPQVRAIAAYKLETRRDELQRAESGASEAERAHRTALARDIDRFLERPGEPLRPAVLPSAPPGAPIGQPAMDWLDRTWAAGGAVPWWPFEECAWGHEF